MIAADLLAAVLAKVAARPQKGDESWGEGLARWLKASFPDLRITVCSADDIPPRIAPAAADDCCSLYYIDASEHCLKLTRDAASACGVVVALNEDD